MKNAAAFQAHTAKFKTENLGQLPEVVKLTGWANWFCAPPKSEATGCKLLAVLLLATIPKELGSCDRDAGNPAAKDPSD